MTTIPYPSADKPTLTQSEHLRVGERGQFIPGAITKERCDRLGIECWVEKRPAATSDFESNLKRFVHVQTSYQLVYGVTYIGGEHEVGNMPRDIGKVVLGITIAATRG